MISSPNAHVVVATVKEMILRPAGGRERLRNVQKMQKKARAKRAKLFLP